MMSLVPLRFARFQNDAVLMMQTIDAVVSVPYREKRKDTDDLQTKTNTNSIATLAEWVASAKGYPA